MIYIYFLCMKYLIFKKLCVMVGVFLGILINEILLLKLGYLMENNI